MFNLRSKHDYFHRGLKLPVSDIVIKMSANQPVIKFSPFEALLIGEKNKVLKRQPMKNTIFVTRLNQKSKVINLRDLFGLEKDTTNSKSNDVIFKMPQRVRDFLKNKKLKYKNNKASESKKEDILCYEFEGQKMIVKSNDSVKPKYKKSKVKSNKVKFKQKYNGDINEKVINKFQVGLENHSRNKKCNFNNINFILNESEEDAENVNRHVLRGKNGKFICESEYKRLSSKEISKCIKQKYLSNYICKFYLKKNKNIFTNGKRSKIPHVVENIVGFSKWHKQFDISSSEKLLNAISKHKCKYNCHEDFKFPKCPIQTEMLDFENDENLVDIIYENFPKAVKFESGEFSCDFTSALKDAEIIKPEKDLETNKKKGILEERPKLLIIFDNRIPLIKLKRIDITNYLPLKTFKDEFVTPADDFKVKPNNIITADNFGSLFLKSQENDLYVGNLVKPFLPNWVGTLQEL